ncbi:hypothetical protein ALTERO38_60485 [Alteromonas sp. 38]|nr:hypothetical protein ALTER154_40310 [Alteromonas sp. 154]VXC23220.1 hypothetical protein ALTERO38_60485 [Alteromonas sp. 38]
MDNIKTRQLAGFLFLVIIENDCNYLILFLGILRWRNSELLPILKRGS